MCYFLLQGIYSDTSAANNIDELLTIKPLTSNVGMYAFSHPGIAATNVMAIYGNELTDIKLYSRARENPTIDMLFCCRK